jgi:hypothetical protein
MVRSAARHRSMKRCMEGNVAVRLLDTDDRFAHEHDALAPARGIVLGFALSLVVWVLVAFVVNAMWPV